MTPEKAKEIDVYRRWISDTKNLVENCEATLEKIARKQGNVQQIFYDNLMIADSNKIFENYVKRQLAYNIDKLKNLEREFGEL